MSKATLTFPITNAGVGSGVGAGINPGNSIPTTSFSVAVIRCSRGYQNQVIEAVTQSRRHGYPLRVKEQDIALTIQCRSLDQAIALKRAIGLTQTLSPLDVQRGYVRFSWPQLQIDVLGYIPQAPEGLRRFDFAPQLSFTIALFKDTINTIAQQYSTDNGTWKDIVGPDYATITPSSTDESILSGSVPPSVDSGNSRGGSGSFDDTQSRGGGGSF